jgi:hypothetical protein
MNVSRDMGKADDTQLAGIQASVTTLLDTYERFMGGTLVEALCMWREAAQRHQERRTQQAAQVKPLRPVLGDGDAVEAPQPIRPPAPARPRPGTVCGARR